MAKEISARKAAAFASEKQQNLLKLRKDGIIDRATFRMLAKQHNLHCARSEENSGPRVPEVQVYLNRHGEEVQNHKWTSSKSAPAIRFTK